MGQPNKHMVKAGRRAVQAHHVAVKAQEDISYFWYTVHQIFTHYDHSRGPPFNRRAYVDYNVLFRRQGATGINFKEYESIPVNRSGPVSDDYPPIENFHNLEQLVPPFLYENLTSPGEKGLALAHSGIYKAKRALPGRAVDERP